MKRTEPRLREFDLYSDAFLSVLHLQGLPHSQAGNVLDFQNVELHQKQLEQDSLLSLFGKT